jgi:hypothetical protein
MKGGALLGPRKRWEHACPRLGTARPGGRAAAAWAQARARVRRGRRRAPSAAATPTPLLSSSLTSRLLARGSPALSGPSSLQRGSSAATTGGAPRPPRRARRAMRAPKPLGSRGQRGQGGGGSGAAGRGPRVAPAPARAAGAAPPPPGEECTGNGARARTAVLAARRGGTRPRRRSRRRAPGFHSVNAAGARRWRSPASKQRRHFMLAAAAAPRARPTAAHAGRPRALGNTHHTGELEGVRAAGGARGTPLSRSGPHRDTAHTRGRAAGRRRTGRGPLPAAGVGVMLPGKAAGSGRRRRCSLRPARAPARQQWAGRGGARQESNPAARALARGDTQCSRREAAPCPGVRVAGGVGARLGTWPPHAGGRRGQGPRAARAPGARMRARRRSRARARGVAQRAGGAGGGAKHTRTAVADTRGRALRAASAG